MRQHVIFALLLAAAGAIGLWWLLGGSSDWRVQATSWLAAINALAFLYYGFDKFCAAHERRRVPELALHGLSLAGGSVGAFLGMQVFRHKTIKGSFRTLFWAIVAAQATLTAWILWKHFE